MVTTERGFVDEKERTMNIVVKEIIPMGYGDAASSISYEKQKRSGELSDEVEARSRELITSGECLRTVTDSDDGCIDGRPAVEVLYADDSGEFYTKTITAEAAAEHVREKVAGGGIVTGYAMLRGIGEQRGASIDDDFETTGDIMNDAHVHCGAHTGGHAHGGGTGCGANDKVRPIFENAVLFRDNIAKNTADLLEVAGVEFDRDVFDEVVDNWADSLTDDAYFEGSTGASRFNKIQETIKKAQQQDGANGGAVSVSKDLAGDHKEDFIIINYVDGHTFSQADFAAKLAEQFPDLASEERAQAFVVDVPRIVKLAQAVDKKHPGKLTKALYAGVAYQLATAATLTDGTLPIFTVQQAA